SEENGRRPLVWTLVSRLLYHAAILPATASGLKTDSFLSAAAPSWSSSGTAGAGRFSTSNSEAYFSIRLASRSAKPLHSSIIGSFPFFFVWVFTKFQYFRRYLFPNCHGTVIVAPQFEVFDLF